MTTINVRHNFPAIAAKLDRLPEQIGNKAMVRALNKTIDQGKTEMARRISSEYRIGVGEAKKRLDVQRASAKGRLRFQAVLAASRKAKGRSMNLIAFVTKGRVSKAAAKRMGNASRAGQIQFQIKRGGGKKVIPGAFVANQGRTVFVREEVAKWNKATRSTLPIKALNTIDIPQMFNARRINTVVRQVILNKFQGNFRRELKVVIEGWTR